MQNIEKLYKEHAKTVNRFLVSLTHDFDIAEELTQETFYKAIQKLNTYKGTAKVSVWLCQIAKNLWYNELKKKKKHISITNEQVQNLQYNKSIDEIIIEDENRRNMYNQIEKLNDNLKEIIYLRIIGELSFKEIGEIMNKTENWARVNYYRGKQKIKEENENEK